ncbi:MAG: hypothetical protein WAP35_00980 [Solirubrobacterales bacterium]
MRIKVITAVAIVAAMAIGVTASNAALRTEASVRIQVKKPGAPAKAIIKVDNTDPGVVPQRVSVLTIASKVAKFNGSAIPACKTPVPSNALGNNNAGEINPPCPSKALVGKGKFSANTGIPGQPLPADFGTIDGDIKAFNYKKSGGEQAALLIELSSDTPVPNAHQYMRVGITKGGVIRATIPNTADLPPQVSNLLRNPDGSYRTTSMASMNLTLSSPRGKKPFFTLKQVKNLDFQVVLERE